MQGFTNILKNSLMNNITYKRERERDMRLSNVNIYIRFNSYCLRIFPNKISLLSANIRSHT